MCLPCKRLSNRALAARTRHPVQDASDSGRTSVTSACAPPRETQLQRLSGLQAGGIAQDASLRVAGNRISPRQRIAWIQRAQLRAGGGQPVARLQAQPRVGLAQLPRGVRHAFGARRVSGLRCSRRCASKATRALRRGPGGRQPEAQAVQALALMFQALRRRHQLAGGAVEALGGRSSRRCWPRASVRAASMTRQLAARSAGQFRRRGRWRAQVGHEVHDGEVGFMAHAADHRNGAGRDLARQRLVIEAPEIFNAAAAAQQQGIHFGALIGQPHLRGQPAGASAPCTGAG